MPEDKIIAIKGTNDPEHNFRVELNALMNKYGITGDGRHNFMLTLARLAELAPPSFPFGVILSQWLRDNPGILASLWIPPTGITLYDSLNNYVVNVTQNKERTRIVTPNPRVFSCFQDDKTKDVILEADQN